MQSIRIFIPGSRATGGQAIGIGALQILTIPGEIAAPVEEEDFPLYRTFVVGDGLVTDSESGKTDFDSDFSPTFVGLTLTGTLTVAEKVGIGTLNPSISLSVNEKSGHTPIGGVAIKLTNKTGGDTVKGQLVEVYSATAIDNAFKTAAANSDAVIGVTYEAGVADGSEAWIVVSGRAEVLIEAGGCSRGDRLISSATAGSAEVWNTGGAVATHFQEIGHCLETRVGAGLSKIVPHFN